MIDLFSTKQEKFSLLSYTAFRKNETSELQNKSLDVDWLCELSQLGMLDY